MRCHQLLVRVPGNTPTWSAALRPARQPGEDAHAQSQGSSKPHSQSSFKHERCRYQSRMKVPALTPSNTQGPFFTSCYSSAARLTHTCEVRAVVATLIGLFWKSSLLVSLLKNHSSAELFPSFQNGHETGSFSGCVLTGGLLA